MVGTNAVWRERERGPFIVMLILRRGQTWVGRDRARARGRAITAASENVGGICLERANYSFTMSREHLEGGAGADKNHAQVKHVSNNMANIWGVNSTCRPCLSGADLLQAIECAHSVICGQCPTPFDRLRDLARGGRGCGIDSIVQPEHIVFARKY